MYTSLSLNLMYYTVIVFYSRIGTASVICWGTSFKPSGNTCNTRECFDLNSSVVVVTYLKSVLCVYSFFQNQTRFQKYSVTSDPLSSDKVSTKLRSRSHEALPHTFEVATANS